VIRFVEFGVGHLPFASDSATPAASHLPQSILGLSLLGLGMNRPSEFSARLDLVVGNESEYDEPAQIPALPMPA